MIWEYCDQSALELSEQEREAFNHYYYSRNPPTLYCQFCKSETARLEFRQDPCVGGCTNTHVEVCKACGWWVVTRYVGYSFGYEGFTGVNRAAGVLRNLNLADISIPTDDLAKYLLARYDSRFWLDPHRYEDVVAGVFSDFWYRVRVTAFSGDDGIDIFVLDGDDDQTVGVQVKRYKGKVGAEQIRSFAGALVLNELTKGIFVTTAKFTAGAQDTATRYGAPGINIELWDAKRFYDKLQISKRSQFNGVDDSSAPYYHLSKNSKLVAQVFGVSW